MCEVRVRSRASPHCQAERSVLDQAVPGLAQDQYSTNAFRTDVTSRSREVPENGLGRCTHMGAMAFSADVQLGEADGQGLHRRTAPDVAYTSGACPGGAGTRPLVIWTSA